MGALAEPVGSIPSGDLLAASHTHAPTGQVAIDQLVRLLAQIQSATRDAEALILARSQADLTSCPQPGAWSVAECFDHLAQTTRAFLPAILAAIHAAPKITGNRRLRTGTLAGLFIRNMEPPYRLRFKVLGQLAPQRQDFQSAWTGFLDSQSQLAEAVHASAGRAIDQMRITSPVYARISYNVYGALRILAAHQRRHLWQIEQILKALDSRQAIPTLRS
jgi:hypothetical protein